MKFLKELFLINLNYFLAIEKIAAISIRTMKLAEPVLSRSTAKNRILDITAPFTNGVFKDTREQAEKLYGALLVNGAKVELVKEETSEGHSESGFASIRQYNGLWPCLQTGLRALPLRRWHVTRIWRFVFLYRLNYFSLFDLFSCNSSFHSFIQIHHEDLQC